VPCWWAARPPSAAIARWRWWVIPAKPRPLLDARAARRGREDLERERFDRVVDVLRDRVRDPVDRGFVERDLLELDRLGAFFFPLDRCDLVSPFSRRILFTVRAATSSARPPYRPDFFALCLMCLYWRSRFGLAPRGMLLLLPGTYSTILMVVLTTRKLIVLV